jgi:hypothetical protein
MGVSYFFLSQELWSRDYFCETSKVMPSLYFGIAVFCPQYLRLESYRLDTEPLPLKYWKSLGSVHHVKSEGTDLFAILAIYSIVNAMW